MDFIETEDGERHAFTPLSPAVFQFANPDHGEVVSLPYAENREIIDTLIGATIGGKQVRFRHPRHPGLEVSGSVESVTIHRGGAAVVRF